MYLKYNAVLRHKGMLNSDDASVLSKECSEEQFQELCGGNYYVSTLHAISSAVVKFGRLAKPRTVYRGIADCVLPASKLGMHGGVEFAFMSTTVQRGRQNQHTASERAREPRFPHS